MSKKNIKKYNKNNSNKTNNNKKTDDVTLISNTDTDTSSVKNASSKATESKSTDIINADTNNKPQLTDFMGNAKDIFSTNKQKYENTMSSAIILLFFGCVGLFVEFLGVIGAIYLPILPFQYVLMFLIFSFFVASGVFSYQKANTYKESMNEEEKQRNNVDYFLNDLLTDKYLSELKSDDLSEEENYLLIIDKLCTMILEKYPKFNKELLEYMIDDYLNEHF